MSFAYQRPDAPFALLDRSALPDTVTTGVGGTAFQVSPLGSPVSVTTGAVSVPVNAPAAEKQIFRYRFIPSETATIVDQSPTGLNGVTDSVFGASERTALYAAEGQPAGAYGIHFFGLTQSANRMSFGIPNNAKFGATRTRFVIGVRPYAVGDFTQQYLTLFKVKTAAGADIFSLVRGLDNSLVFGPGFPEATTALILKDFFVENTHCLIEVELDGQDVRIWKDHVLVSDDYTLQARLNWTAANIRVGNQGTAGGGPLWGHISHFAAYSGDLTEGEVRWVRDTAKAMIETAPKVLTTPTPPAPMPESQLKVTRSPAFNVRLYAIQGEPITFRNGRASDGIGGPIAQSFTLTLAGVNVRPARGFTLVPNNTGNLVLTDTFDNAIHPVQQASVTLPILQSFPALDEATIKSRLGGVGNIFIDNSDAGFPFDGAWRRSLVVDPGDGTVGLRLLPNNQASGRPALGGSVQANFLSDTGSNTPGVAARIGRVQARMQLIDTRAPGLAKGYVQTFFTFTNPFTLPRRELDIEINPRTGLAELAFHLQGNDAGAPASRAIHIGIVIPESAFTGMREWEIVLNADRTEWYYEGQLAGRYIRGFGFDPSIQTFSPKKITGSNTYVDFLPGDTHLHPNDAGWHLNPQNFIIQQWMSYQQTGWLGANTVPLNHPLLRFGACTAQEFGPNNMALQAGDWTATATGDGQVQINVSNYRPLRFVPTHLEARVDGGAWTRLSGTTGNRVLGGVPTGARAIQVRAVAESLATNPATTTSNTTINGNASDTKNVTVT